MVLTSNPYDKYKQQGVMTASPMELIVMLFDGCVRQLKVAALAYGQDNRTLANEALLKAQAIVHELMLCLDRSYDIAKELYPIYDFIENSIYQMIQSGEHASLADLTEIVTDMRGTWNEVARQTRASSLAIEE